jgi:uncharacterized membrane protein (UPF0127 family)
LAYRFRVLGRQLAVLTVLAVVLAVALVWSAAAGVASPAGPTATTKLVLDRVAFRPELALTSEQRSRGLMNRPQAPRDGMLFVFPGPTTSGFWMKNTLVPLTIVFFDRGGQQVRKLSMKPCRRDPCPIYSPGHSYRFALELSATDRRPARQLGPTAKLERLSDAAS